MNAKAIKKAIAEAHRFIAAVKDLHTVNPEAFKAGGEDCSITSFPKETGAVRRASMDLTRALAQVRKVW